MRRLCEAALVLALITLGLGAAHGKRPTADEEADERDLQEIKAALLKDRPPTAATPPPPPPTAALVRTADWLPELGATTDILFSYSKDDSGPTDDDRGVTALVAPPEATGSLPTSGMELRIELSLQKVIEGAFRLDAYGLVTTEGFSLLAAEASTLALPFRLKLRGGYLLHRFGVQNSFHPHALPMPLRPLSLERTFGRDGGRGLGAEASWQAPLPWLVEVAAAVLGASGPGALSFYGNETTGTQAGIFDLLYVVTLKQYAPLGRGLGAALGLSAAFGPNPSGRRNRTDVYGADLSVRLLCRGTRVDLLSEWLWRRRQVPGGLLEDVSGYGELGIAPPPGRLFLRLRLRYEYGGAVVDDGLWPSERHRLAIGADLGLFRTVLLRAQGLVDLSPTAPLLFAGYGAFLALQLRLGPHGMREADPHGLLH